MATSQFTIYRSTDAGAPVISADTGSLKLALDAILVTGYGNKPAAGWSADFTASNNSGSTYRPPSGSRLYLSVDDYFPISTPRMARVLGIESPETYNTGSNQFPSASTVTPYYLCRKALNLNTSSRAWTCIADAYTMYLFINCGDSPADAYSGGVWFGDYYTSSATPHEYNCFLVGLEYQHRSDQQTIDPNFATLGRVDQWSTGHVLARSWTRQSGSVRCGFMGSAANHPSASFKSTIAYPNPVDNSTWISPVYIAESTNTVGKVRGMYHGTANFDQVSDGEQFSGSGEYAGRTFMYVSPVLDTTDQAYSVIIIETSNTLDTN